MAKNYDVYKMKVNIIELGSVPKSTENPGLESNLAMMKHVKSRSVQSHVSDPVPDRRAQTIGQFLDVGTYNI